MYIFELVWNHQPACFGSLKSLKCLVTFQSDLIRCWRGWIPSDWKSHESHIFWTPVFFMFFSCWNLDVYWLESTGIWNGNLQLLECPNFGNSAGDKFCWPALAVTFRSKTLRGASQSCQNMAVENQINWHEYGKIEHQLENQLKSKYIKISHLMQFLRSLFLMTRWAGLNFNHHFKRVRVLLKHDPCPQKRGYFTKKQLNQQ